MSVKMTARVWAIEDEELKDARLLTLLSLADYANSDDLSWPSVPTLAKRTRISERQIQRSIHWLEQAAYIKITEKGNGRGRVTTYKLLVKGDISDIKGDTMTPFSEELTPVDSIKGDISDIKGDIGEEIQSYVRIEPLTTEPLRAKGTKSIVADATPAPPVAPVVTVLEKPKGKRTAKPKEPPHTSEITPREPSEWQEFVGAFCWLCHAHKEVGTLTKEQRGALLAEAKVVHDDGYDTDNLREWYKSIWLQSWQWKKDRSRPKPADVRSSIAQLRAETPEGFEVSPVLNGNHSTNNGINAVLAYRERRGYQ